MEPIHEQSISNMEAEVTVICVDNSALVTSIYGGGGVYKAQAKAIALYCKEKFKAHPDNEVGLLAMGEIQGTGFVGPTRDLRRICSKLKGLLYLGQMCIPIGQALCFFLNSHLPKRRLVVFSGGRLSMDSDELEDFAAQFKAYNVAVDVVNFGVQCRPSTKKQLLEAFVAAADNNGNSHYLYAPSGSRTSLAQQILSSPLAPQALPMQEDKKKAVAVKKLANNSTTAFVPDGCQNLSSRKRFKYDVFLSFRGEDTRRTFVDHLKHALEERGFTIYKDDERIQRGRRISDDLIKAIEDSKLHIIVFSKNYASSTWCLQELVKIMECGKIAGHTAYPLFYDVEPTEVSKQSEAVGQAFAEHENREAAGKWRGALKEAANLDGLELKNPLDRHGAEFIKKIVHEISLIKNYHQNPGPHGPNKDHHQLVHHPDLGPDGPNKDHHQLVHHPDPHNIRGLLRDKN